MDALPLPLATVHQALQAAFRDEDGWQVVAHYASPTEEHRAARRTAGLFDLSHRGRLEITGPDRASWLHNLLSNDIRGLTPGHGCYATFLTPQAKIRGDMNVLALPDSLLLDCEGGLVQKLLAELGHYRITERVELRNRTPEFGLLALQGPQAPTILDAWAGPTACPTRELDHVSFHLNGMSILIIRRSLTGDPGFHCLVPVARMPELWQRLMAIGRPYGMMPCGMEALETLRIEAGIPRYGHDMDETTLLPEAGLDQAVSPNKGCYLGQEFVVRIRDRGQLTRKLSLLALEGTVPASRGAPIASQDREIGTVTSCAVIPTHGRPLALGYLHRDYSAPGTVVTVRTAHGAISAMVITPTILPVNESAEDVPGHSHDHPHDHPHDH